MGAIQVLKLAFKTTESNYAKNESANNTPHLFPGK